MPTLRLEEIDLDRGNHQNADEGMCVMEATAYIAGEPFSDKPVCVHPDITRHFIDINDECESAAERNAILRPYIPEIIGTRGLTLDLAPAEKAYREATATAEKAYREAKATAWKAYREATATAEKAYREAKATAWKAYQEATAPAEKAYREATAPARKQFVEAIIAEVRRARAALVSVKG